jgi:hypothetical protein
MMRKGVVFQPNSMHLLSETTCACPVCLSLSSHPHDHMMQCCTCTAMTCWATDNYTTHFNNHHLPSHLLSTSYLTCTLRSTPQQHPPIMTAAPRAAAPLRSATPAASCTAFLLSYLHPARRDGDGCSWPSRRSRSFYHSPRRPCHCRPSHRRRGFPLFCGLPAVDVPSPVPQPASSQCPS